MFFKKIKPAEAAKKKSIYVAEQIMEAINRGDYKVNERLPSERKIAEEMGVSRVPVREALSALQVVGIVDSIPGAGSYVRKLGESPLIRSQAISVLEESESPFEAHGARRIFEAGIMGLVINKANPGDLAKIEEVFQRMSKAVEAKNFDEYFKSNRDFHLAIAQATHNSLIERTIAYLLNVMDQPLWKEAAQKHLSDYEHIKEYLHKHRRIFTAIKNKDRGFAEKEMKKHFDETVEEIRRYL
ncbi:FadR family transcriptional regulator [Candidatus Aerophobetes bacterium]|uniref:FadR family transcriptional regulator n=1 Tax=Aerophobetes bacterium TaxID=2030807 RepID=A0A523TC93_UNCAE|nr:MAG: FadR family transcriptional regulator [Candidatus Aerophobetes bacterium]